MKLRHPPQEQTVRTKEKFSVPCRTSGTSDDYNINSIATYGKKKTTVNYNNA